VEGARRRGAYFSPLSDPRTHITASHYPRPAAAQMARSTASPSSATTRCRRTSCSSSRCAPPPFHRSACLAPRALSPTRPAPLFSGRRAPQTNQKTGLSTPEVEERRLKWGWNELAEKKVNPILQFLAYFWGPMPCMIWLAVAVEFIKGVLGEGGRERARARVGANCCAQCTLSPRL